MADPAVEADDVAARRQDVQDKPGDAVFGRVVVRVAHQGVVQGGAKWDPVGLRWTSLDGHTKSSAR